MPFLSSVLVERLRRDIGAVAMIEFALTLPIILLMAVTGAELTNYITTKMRVSQLALEIADNAARMGNGSQLSAKTIGEADINDVFIGAQLASGSMNLQTNGKVILSNLQPVASPNTTNKYYISWQRCYGTQPHISTYGSAAPIPNGQTVAPAPTSTAQQMDGIGPPGDQVTAQDGNATMFAEVYITYKPLFSAMLAPSTSFVEHASMAVRDRRDLTQILSNDTPSNCP